MAQPLLCEAFYRPFLCPPQAPLKATSSLLAPEFSLCDWMILLALLRIICMPVLCDQPPGFSIVRGGSWEAKSLSPGSTISLLRDLGPGPLQLQMHVHSHVAVKQALD